ncbi:ATP synthase subunit C lysine N-methyltransferase-like isoform X1 [Tigriopus californicus]|uniref:ATP synthase subunit C lysine N-methyltransferase-like isoform X1 n=1 Tax=Tigriopus californicus TaxID=6832 RepID=UPI0027D9DE82|nr:ATP synthase subunit C lysine N-methyltransferase-like isoform X1 [Tigriopus californicus]
MSVRVPTTTMAMPQRPQTNDIGSPALPLPIPKEVSPPACDDCQRLQTEMAANPGGPKMNTTGWILLGITGGSAVALTVLCGPFVTPALRKVCLPYVPATTAQVENVFTALKGRSGSLVDIGSGDGRIVYAGAQRGFRAHGIELNPWLVLFAQLRARRWGLNRSATFARQDLWQSDLRHFDNVVIFGVQEMMPQLEAKLDRELSVKSCVVACRFPFPNWKPINVVGEGIDTVWLYRPKT